MPEDELPVLPGLRLVREIGRGGAGVVYEAERVEDGARVAVKVLPDGHVHAEARRAAAVDHPGIVRVLDAGDTWLVLEFVDGPNLQEVLDRRGPLPPPFAVQVLAQAADAVAAVHVAGLAHGDLKPGNILLRRWPDGDTTLELSRAVLVTDFGLAHPLPDERRPTGPAQVPAHDAPTLSQGTEWLATNGTLVERVRAAGTVAYMAPEQWRGDPPTARTDVYALGATLYAALTGARPYPQPSLPELAYAVATEAPPAPSRVPGVPPALDAVVARAMAKDPADRYADAAAFAAALRGADAPPKPSRRRWRGRAGRVLSTAGLLVALLCFGSGFLTVSCTPGGYGHAAPGGTTTYTGIALATGGEPRVDKPRPVSEYRPDRLGGQPLIALAALALLGAAVLSVLRRRRHRPIAVLAGVAAVALAIGEAVARAELTDQYAAQVTGPLPQGRHVGDYIHVGNAFWGSLLLATVVAAAHALALKRSRRAAAS
jgi:hypothetical protein